MKKFSRILFCAVAVALASAGCVKSDEKPGGKDEGNSTLVKFYADLAEEDGSRANINTGDGAFTCEWEDGDMLGVVPIVDGTKHGAYEFKYNGADFAFEGTLPSGAQCKWEYMAFYPHAAITHTSESTTAHVPFGNLRIQNGNSFNSGFDPLVARVETHENANPGKKSGSDEVVAFALKRLTSIINLKTSGSGSGNARYVRVSTEGGEPLSAASIDFDLTKGYSNYKKEAALSNEEQSDVIVIGFEEGTAPAANNIDAFINIPAGNYNNLVFEVYTSEAKRGSVSVSRSDPSKPFEAGTLYRKQASGMQFEDVAAPTMVWEGQDMNAVHDITAVNVEEELQLTYSAAISITTDAAIAGLEVMIESDVLNNNFGLTSLDLFNDTDVIPGILSFERLGLDCTTKVQYKKSTVFDITKLLPLILELEPEPGSLHTFNVTVTDLAGQQKIQPLTFRVPSSAPAEPTVVYNGDANLWTNTASFLISDVDTGAQSVSLEYRIKDGEWKAARTEATGEGSYKASIEAEWTTGTNSAGHTIYTVDPKTGVFAKNEYEYQLKINGTVVRSGEFTPGNNGGDPIIGFTKTTSCFTSSNTDAPFWGSGNNSYTSGLCTYDTASSGALMTATSSWLAALAGINVAPGNLFSGTFGMSGTNGTVSFGQKYTYTARPTALKFKWKGSIGTVTANDKGGPLAKGEQDQASFRVCIIDWSARHETKSGTSISGAWDPETKSGLSAAETIIGYGATYPTSAPNDMTEIILPINYYDKDAVAPTGNYTIVISCATSRYGDYLNGSKNTKIYVSDFEWVY